MRGATRVAKGAAAPRNGFLSRGARRFGPASLRDHLRLAWRAARRWDDPGPGVVPWTGPDVRCTDRSSLLFLAHEIFVGFEPGGAELRARIPRASGCDEVQAGAGISGADGVIRARRAGSGG
jgi:hypothetical protein